MQRERLWSPVFILIVVFIFCGFLFGQGANAGTSVYLDRVGIGSGLAGIGALVFSLAAAVSRIVCGPLSDHRGRATTMLLGAICMIIGGMGPTFTNDGTLFVIWRSFQGFGFAAATTAAATAAADVLPRSRLGEGIGYSGLGQALAMSVGPATAIFLIYTDVPENFYYGICLVALVSAILAFFCRYEKNPEKLPETSEYRLRWERGEVPHAEGGSDEPAAASATEAEDKPRSALGALLYKLFEPKALPGAIPLMFLSAAFGFSIFFMGIFGESLGVTNAGIYYTLAAVIMIVIRLTSGKFMDKVAPIKIMGVGVIFGLIGFGMVFACTLLPAEPIREWVFYLAGLPVGLSMGLTVPINQSVAVKNSPPSRWGAANGLFYLLYDLVIGTVSMVFGFVIASFGFGPTIIAVLFFIVISYGAALVCYPKEPKSHA